MSVDEITLVTSRTLYPSKHHTYRNGKHHHTKFYDNILTWDHRRLSVDNLRNVFSVIKKIEVDPHTMVIRGHHQDESGSRVHRLKHVFTEINHNWLMLDFDDVEAVTDVDPTSQESLNRAAIEAIKKYLPYYFHDRDVIIQWSNSAGVKPWTHLRLHLWFWLDRPMSNLEVKAWYHRDDFPMHEVEGKNGKTIKKVVDLSLTSCNQPHYTTMPRFSGIEDPFPLRAAVFVDGDHRDVEAPPSGSLDAEIGKKKPARKRSEAQRSQPLFDFVPTIKTTRYGAALCKGMVEEMRDVDKANASDGRAGLHQPRHTSIRNRALRLGSYYAGGEISEKDALKTLNVCTELAEIFREDEGRNFREGFEFGQHEPKSKTEKKEEPEEEEEEIEEEEIEENIDDPGEMYNEAAWVDQLPRTSETALAQWILGTYTHPFFKSTGNKVVFCAGELWRVDDPSQLWVKITKYEIGQRLMLLDGQATTKGKGIKIDLKHFNAVDKLMKGSLLPQEDDFFVSTRFGFATGGQFIEVNEDGELSSVPLSKDHRQRFSLDAVVDIHEEGSLWGTPGTLLNRFLMTIHRPNFTATEWAALPDKEKDELEQDEKDKILAMSQLVFAMLTQQAPKYHRAVMLKGAPGTGKSQFILLLQALVSMVAQCSLSPQLMADMRHVGDLEGKILNSKTEVRSDFSDTTELNAIVMGELTRAKYVHKQPFEFYPRALNAFAGNQLPRFTGSLSAAWDRWLPILFLNRFRDAKKEDAVEDVKDIGKIIGQTEVAEVIKWALYGGRILTQEEQYRIPSSSSDVFEEWRQDSDPVAAWRDTETEKLETSVLKDWPTLADAHKEFKRWAEPQGYKEMNRRTFSRKLQDLGVEVKKSGSRKCRLSWTLPKKKEHPPGCPF